MSTAKGVKDGNRLMRVNSRPAKDYAQNTGRELDQLTRDEIINHMLINELGQDTVMADDSFRLTRPAKTMIGLLA